MISQRHFNIIMTYDIASCIRWDCTHPCVLAFITCMLCATALIWLLSGEFHVTKLLLVTYFSNLQFASLRLNTVKRTWHGDSMVGGALDMLLRLWKFATALRCHMVCIKTSHNAWMRPEYFITRHREIHRSSVLDWWKQWRTDENPYCACPPVL